MDAKLLSERMQDDPGGTDITTWVAEVSSLESRVAEFEAIARDITDPNGNGPYEEDDYGHVFCFFCGVDSDKPHADDCAWQKMVNLLAGATSDIVMPEPPSA